MTQILIIEDDVTVRSNIAELLDAEEYEVVTAENGFAGVLWSQEHIPGLVICDMMMPELDGRDVLTALREDPRTESIPFIFLTARADKSDIRLGMNLGADDYLTKPFTRKELLDAVNARMKKHQYTEERYNEVHEYAESLEQEIETLKKGKEEKIQDLEKRIEDATPKLEKAIKLLVKVPAGTYRNKCLALLKETFSEEISSSQDSLDLSGFLMESDMDILEEIYSV